MNVLQLISNPYAVTIGVVAALMYFQEAYHRATQHGAGFWTAIGWAFSDMATGLATLRGNSAQFTQDFAALKADVAVDRQLFERHRDQITQQFADLKAVVDDIKSSLPQKT
jgi:hypothetical protein